ncbi:MAG: glycerol kinase GlpK [Alphaproteobacteria bacterium]
MAALPLILAIDQGTTSTRALLFDGAGGVQATAQVALPQIFPRDGWVEHDPEIIWRDTVQVCRDALATASDRAVAAVGITNQRETAIVWDRASGRPVHNAIVWQDRRGAALCQRMVADGHEAMIQARTGLLADSYFSASKIVWLLDHVDGARAAAQAGRLAFGTVDSFLLWRLTDGKVHATDATNAARTLLFDVHRQDWDEDLLRLFGVPRAMLPEVVDCAGRFGETTPSLFGQTMAITGMAGDQHAAMVGQACVAPGMMKATFGTGGFIMLNTGDRVVASRNRLLTTPAWRLDGRVTWALEGSIFVAGAALQWLRDGLGVIGAAAESEPLARALDGNGGVYLVPAFTGLGAPHWDAAARGALFGLTRDTGRGHLARAALEAVAYQTCDLLQAMQADGAPPPATLRVDGGMAVNDWLMQFLADMADLPVERAATAEATAAGAALLAGYGAGLHESVERASQVWRAAGRFDPGMTLASRQALVRGWQTAIGRLRGSPA